MINTLGSPRIFKCRECDVVITCQGSYGQELCTGLCEKFFPGLSPSKCVAGEASRQELRYGVVYTNELCQECHANARLTELSGLLAKLYPIRRDFGPVEPPQTRTVVGGIPLHCAGCGETYGCYHLTDGELACETWDRSSWPHRVSCGFAGDEKRCTKLLVATGACSNEPEADWFCNSCQDDPTKLELVKQYAARFGI